MFSPFLHLSRLSKFCVSLSCRHLPPAQKTCFRHVKGHMCKSWQKRFFDVRKHLQIFPPRRDACLTLQREKRKKFKGNPVVIRNRNQDMDCAMCIYVHRSQFPSLVFKGFRRQFKEYETHQGQNNFSDYIAEEINKLCPRNVSREVIVKFWKINDRNVDFESFSRTHTLVLKMVPLLPRRRFANRAEAIKLFMSGVHEKSFS